MTEKKKITQPTSKKSKVTEYVDDLVITTKIKAGLAADDFIRSLSIHVQTNDGVVLLMGDVPSQESLDRIKEIASDVKGVKKIISNLEIVE